MWPDLWLRLPVANFESNTTTFGRSSGLDSSEILGFELGNEVLHIHFSILEHNVKLTGIVVWVNFNHSIKSFQILSFASSFLLFNLAEVHGLDAFFVGVMVTFFACVVLEVAFTEWNFSA